jgi:hypothetical protein
MAESNTLFYLIDQQEITNVKNTIKDPTDEEIDLHTDPSTIVEQPEGGLSRLTCPFANLFQKTRYRIRTAATASAAAAPKRIYQIRLSALRPSAVKLSKLKSFRNIIEVNSIL